MRVSTSAGRSEAEFEVGAPAQEVLRRLQAGLAARKRFTLVDVDDRGLQLTARPNWAAWGARLTVRVAPLGGSASLVRVRWEPALPTTVVIWGQGARDIRTIEQLTRA